VDPAHDIYQRTALNELFLEVIFPALTDVKVARYTGYAKQAQEFI
jgi:hypothetical protein